MHQVDGMSAAPVEVQGAQGKLATFDAGTGKRLPVLFLHADSGSADQWRPLQQRIAAERRAVCFDFRGHGASEPAANDDYGYACRAEDVARVADNLDLGRFVLVAHSGGAAVALEYAARHRERVAGLLLIDPPTDPRALPPGVRAAMLQGLASPDSLQIQKGFYAGIAGANPSVHDQVLADCERVVPAARLGVAEALARWNPQRSLYAWRGPIHIVSSTANDNGHALYDLRPDIPHEVIPEVGHWIQLERPALIEQIIQRFVSGVEGR
jgi:pimeloyl-ACP methyl ester carboxylesterase